MSRVMDGILMGFGATVMLDVWNLVLRFAFGIRSLDYCLLGRWVRHLPDRFAHRCIIEAAPRSHECTVGWIAHYSIGIALGVGLALAVARPTLPAGLLYGVATVVLPYFVLQPALGFGIASARAPKPWQARTKSLGTHVVFGLGLYVMSLLVRSG